MKEGERIEKIYLENSEIKQIIDLLKKHSFEDYHKSTHYELSILSKGTSEDELKKIYSRFDLIKLIILRKRITGYENYDIYYELEKGNYALFAIHLNNLKKPRLDNAFITNTIFKNFLKSIIKRYGREMI
jgi:hypothetical protein